MRCLIVDDEPLAQQVLEKHINMLGGLTLVGKCSNAIQAISALQKEQIDLLLLDIQMPELSGLEMLRHLRRPPQVILTTAFSEHAILAFELEVADYLLKPISFERFARAIDKVRRSAPVAATSPPPQSRPYIFLRADRKMHKVLLSEIILIEGLSNYLKVYTEKQMLIIREKMSDIEEMLPADQFMRVHKSFIVSLSHIQYTEGNLIVMNKHQVPIGETYRTSFLEYIKGH